MSGYALAHPETAALLTERRPPAPISGFAAAIAAAALRDPRLGDVEATVAERERVRAALVAAGYESWPTATNFVYIKTDEPLGERLEAEGIVVRIYPDGIRVTLGRPSENDRFLSRARPRSRAAPAVARRRSSGRRPRPRSGSRSRSTATAARASRPVSASSTTC